MLFFKKCDSLIFWMMLAYDKLNSREKPVQVLRQIFVANLERSNQVILYAHNGQPHS